MRNSKKIKIIEKLLDNRGFSIIYDKKCIGYSSYINFEKKTIHVSKFLDIKYIVCIVLHEIGHILLSEDINYKINYRYSSRILEENSFLDSEKLHKIYSKNRNYRIDLLNEEFDAWRKGYEFAKDNNIKINKNNFSKVKNKCLYMYIKWVVSEVFK